MGHCYLHSNDFGQCECQTRKDGSEMTRGDWDRLRFAVTDLTTALQSHAQARDEALEEAAKLLEDKYGHLRMVDVYAYGIRALKVKP